MPLKLNVGLSKKIGKPDYGSLGATCNVEIVIESSTTEDDARAISRYAEQAFEQCRNAVDRELSRCDQEHGQETSARLPQSQKPKRNQAPKNSPGPAATEKQIRALHAIANKQRLDLVSELVERFSVEHPNQLTVRQASEMIDAMKSIQTV